LAVIGDDLYVSVLDTTDQSLAVVRVNGVSTPGEVIWDTADIDLVLDTDVVYDGGNETIRLFSQASMAASPDGNRVYLLSNENDPDPDVPFGAGRLWAINTADDSFTSVEVADAGVGVSGVTVSADNTEVYVTQLLSSLVSVIAANDLSTVATISTGDLALPFVAAPVGTDLYVVNSRFGVDPPVDGDVLVTPQPGV
jgi:DNA-binding beta-propeller fold protein YncE